MDPQIASEFCIRDLAPACKCAINHGSICSWAKGHRLDEIVDSKAPILSLPLFYLFFSFFLPDIRNGAEVNISCAQRFRRWENGKEGQGHRFEVKRVAEKGWLAAWSYEAPSGRNNRTTRGVI